MGDQQRREFHEALLDADRFEDLPGKWQAAIMKAEERQPKLGLVGATNLVPSSAALISLRRPPCCSARCARVGPLRARLLQTS
jgi:hypothetical protein